MLWWVPLAAGFQDGVNPCVLMTCAVMLALRMWLQRAGSTHIKRLLFLFVLSVLGFDLILNLSAFGIALSARFFQNIVVIGYYALSAVFLAAGIVFFVDWAKGRIFEPQTPKVRPDPPYYGLMGLGFLMSAASTIWPTNAYITILSNNLMMPGQFLLTFIPLSVYLFVRLWLVILLAFLFTSAKLTPRMRQMVSAAIFLSAAGAVIYTF